MQLYSVTEYVLYEIKIKYTDILSNRVAVQF